MYIDLFVRKSKGQFEKVSTQGVVLIETSSGCTKIITGEVTYQVSSTIDQLENQLPSSHFCRVHRNYIVALERIDGISDNSVRVLDKDIPLSITYAEKLFSRLNIII